MIGSGWRVRGFVIAAGFDYRGSSIHGGKACLVVGLGRMVKKEKKEHEV